MEKIERNLIEPVGEVNFEKSQYALSRWFSRLQSMIRHLLLHKGLLIILVGFLLGRALILAKITPFALPFFAAVLLIRKDRAGLAMLALLAGSMTLSVNATMYVFGSIVLFTLCHKISKRLKFESVKALPFLVLIASLLTKTSIVYLTQGELTLYDGMLSVVEAGLGFILTLIFLQSVPLLTVRKRHQTLKTEEVICIIILIASVMTGTIGWSIYDLSVEHILSRYLVLLFAFVAGATTGSTVGVVTGLVLSLANVASLYQMSLLAFSGLLGGLLKDGKKVGVSIGLIIGTLLIGLYGEGSNQLLATLYESLIAIALFLVTPQIITSNLAKFIPGTSEHSAEQQQYLRKIRDVTANRVSQFSNVFQALSNSFSNYGLPIEEEDQDREIDYFLSNVTEKTCQTCFKKEQCWSKNFTTTYDYMKKIMHEIDDNSMVHNHQLNREWDKHCVKSKKVIDAIGKEFSHYQANQKLKKQVLESRRLVADQLLGVSQVMGDFAKEIQRERENHHLQEEQILESLQAFGIEIGHVEIYNLEQGNVDIEMSIPYCNASGESEKIIAPMLSDILGETISVKKEECSAYPNGYCHVSFGSVKAFVIETGVAHAAKGGGLVSGDCYSTIELGVGKYAVAISDGMGNGVRAHHESNETLQLLQKILKSGIEEKVAIKSVNSILSLRTTDEIFSTLDLAMIDLQDASAKFLKIGSTPSYVKRGEKIIRIQASNLPMGIIQEFEVDVVSEQLKAGDFLIMMSDGVFEGPRHVENYDMWMKRKISEIDSKDPQEIADILMEEVIRTRAGNIQDDMTVVVTQIKRNIPKWAAIPSYSYRKKAQ
ncbi:stage II sporulation protein E [Bacillus luteolus]|uniref:Stage II sporulation protein E n=1 Tax=Litchfieldia luteola TaxID=682179 RepID=A0ABR9QDV7_9BACI|nr:stage II sporulation protein E [Cytobacillus luteolus]MBE4906678.1 stage II sporulation protein E [Cytobacillus luteolus]MBP1944405.1 stage II sporulation protein E [Cytobacillus luteolus]